MAGIGPGRSAGHATTNDSIFRLPSCREIGCFVRNGAVVPASPGDGVRAFPPDLPLSPPTSGLLVEPCATDRDGDLHLPLLGRILHPFSLRLLFCRLVVPLALVARPSFILLLLWHWQPVDRYHRHPDP